MVGLAVVIVNQGAGNLTSKLARCGVARGAALTVAGIAGMAVAYLLVWTVLRDPDMTDKLMNVSAPPPTAVVGNRIAVIAAIVAALGAWTATVASRRVVPVLRVVLASAPLVPMTLFTLVLAF